MKFYNNNMEYEQMIQETAAKHFGINWPDVLDNTADDFKQMLYKASSKADFEKDIDLYFENLAACENNEYIIINKNDFQNLADKINYLNYHIESLLKNHSGFIIDDLKKLEKITDLYSEESPAEAHEISSYFTNWIIEERKKTRL